MGIEQGSQDRRNWLFYQRILYTRFHKVLNVLNVCVITCKILFPPSPPPHPLQTKDKATLLFGLSKLNQTHMSELGRGLALTSCLLSSLLRGPGSACKTMRRCCHLVAAAGNKLHKEGPSLSTPTLRHPCHLIINTHQKH